MGRLNNRQLDEYVSTPEIPPDDRHILFTYRASQGNTQVWILNRDGNHPRLLNDTINKRGHSSWSVSDLITLDMGGSFKHEIYVINFDGENLHQISEAGNNTPGESFFPDGNWMVQCLYRCGK